MSTFRTRLRTESLPADLCRDGVQRYMVIDELVYDSEAFGAITVPDGFLTDLASIPRAAWLYLSPADPVIEYASVIHDWLYSQVGKLPTRTLTRAECDEVLREAMLASGARSTQATVVYRAVRLFGGSHWKSP